MMASIMAPLGFKGQALRAQREVMRLLEAFRMTPIMPVERGSGEIRIETGAMVVFSCYGSFMLAGP